MVLSGVKVVVLSVIKVVVLSDITVVVLRCPLSLENPITIWEFSITVPTLQHNNIFFFHTY